MKDPTIPRKGDNSTTRRPARPSIGYFVRIGTDVVLTDTRGGRWSSDAVRLLSGWGGAHSGVQRPPRPFEFNPDGSVLVDGDQGLILFLQDNPKQPVFLPGARSVTAIDPDLPSRSHEGPPNALLLRQAHLPNGSNTADSFFDIVVEEDGQGAEIRIKPAAGPALRIRLDKSTGEIQIDQGGARSALVKDALLTDLGLAMKELATVIGAIPTPPTPAQYTTVTKLAALLGTPGQAPLYVTTHLTAE